MKLTWDQVGERVYETGVDHGVLYLQDNSGAYTDGVAWNGLTTVTETPSGAEASPQYADNTKYLNLVSAETFEATVEAFTYPDEFAECDGTAELVPGVTLGQQSRKPFGLCYRTKVGTDLNSEAGVKLHLVYGGQAAPSEKAYSTVNDSPEAIAFSWTVSTTPVAVGTIDGKEYKPTSLVVVDSTKVDATAFAALEDVLYGTEAVDPRLPLPAEVYSLFSGTVTEVTATAPTYNASTDIITIPSVVGVEYLVGGEVVAAGPYGPITKDTVVQARPTPGHVFSDTSDDDWTINFS